MSRLSLLSPLTSDEVTVRELNLDDAPSLVAAAAVRERRGRLPLPTTVAEATAWLAGHQTRRSADIGNVFGMSEPGSDVLAGVASLRLEAPDDLVAQAVVSVGSDKQSRYTMAHGVALLVPVIHRDMNIIRVWAVLDSLDPMAKHLLWTETMRKEAEQLQSDGHLAYRYSSVTKR